MNLTRRSLLGIFSGAVAATVAAKAGLDQLPATEPVPEPLPAFKHDQRLTHDDLNAMVDRINHFYGTGPRASEYTSIRGKPIG